MDGASLYAYDGFNRQISARSGGTAASYTYNASGLRASKTVNGVTTRHVWDGSDIVLDLGGADGLVSQYIRGIGLIAERAASSEAGCSYYLFNAHGDVVQTVNSAGTVTKTYDYDAFGVEKNPDAGDTNPWRYCGEYFDKETGTVYLRARYYDPGTGRFTSEDPIGDGLNWYVYCSNNPIMFVDPWGLEAYYIFYNDKSDKDNGWLYDRAKKEYDALIKSGVAESDIYIKMITSETQFFEEWENMSNGDDPILT